jgi:hypothetical protein
MYPQPQLMRLAERKAALQCDVRRRRRDCVAAAVVAGRPLVWLDRMMSVCRRLLPLAKFAAVPVGALLAGASSRRIKFLGSIMKWSPLVFGVLSRAKIQTKPI